MLEDVGYVGEDQQCVGVKRLGEYRCGVVLVDHGLDASQHSRPKAVEFRPCDAGNSGLLLGIVLVLMIGFVSVAAIVS